MEKQIQLVRLLLTKTNEGKLQWKETTNELAFQTSFAQNSVWVLERPRAGDPDYVISLINGTGTVVESFSDIDLREASGDTGWYTILRELFEKARRSALGSDIVLKEILSSLEDNV